MAIRVEPNADLDFGIMSAAVAVTHTRVQKAGAAPTVRPLGATLNVGAGERLRIPATAFDAVYPDGQFSRAHMDAVIKCYWEGETFQVDCMTDANTPVADRGYSQIEHSSWNITQEAD